MSNPLSPPLSQTPIKPAPDRIEPVVWVQRLAVMKELSAKGEILREVTFRRGVNIIHTASREPSDRRTVGHSVGKTLLVRLIRYVLGEHSFGTAADRSGIANLIPAGYVAAHLRVAGEAWVVSRPIGLELFTGGSWSAKGEDVSVLFSDGDERRKFSECADAISAATTACFTGMILPHQRREAGWPDLLAWISRDQKCRYRHPNEWRDPETESGTGRLQREDASLVMRMVMDLLDADERKLREKHAELLREKADLERQQQRLESFLELSERELRRLLSITDAPTGSNFAPVAMKACEDQRQSLERLLADYVQSDPAGALAGEDRRLGGELAVVARKITESTGVQTATKQEAERLEKVSSDDFWAEMASQAGWCHLYTKKEDAFAQGCPGKHMKLATGQRDPAHEKRLGEVRAHLQSLDGELKSLADEQQRLQQQHAKNAASLAKASSDYQQRVRAMQERIGRYSGLHERAEELDTGRKNLRATELGIQKKTKAIEESLEKQDAARQRLGAKHQQLSQYFDATLRTLLASDEGGEIELNSRGLYPQPSKNIRSSGEAIGTSATVLGLDLACLVASICGLGSAPRLLIHDSPREADMEEPLYHRLFEFAASLEGVYGGAQPAFQYIVTTTTRPPDQLAEAPYVRLVLDARRDDGLLLKSRY